MAHDLEAVKSSKSKVTLAEGAGLAEVAQVYERMRHGHASRMAQGHGKAESREI